MRTVFPALHDRLLTSLFWTACALLGLAIAAVFIQRPKQRPQPSTAPVVTHPLVFTGASPSQ